MYTSAGNQKYDRVGRAMLRGGAVLYALSGQHLAQPWSTLRPTILNQAKSVGRRCVSAARVSTGHA